MRAAMIIPTYNEAANIEPLIRALRAPEVDVDAIVVDDGSPDGTGERVLSLARDDPRVDLVQRARKMGLGTAYKAGFRRALERGFALVGTMDADFSHHPRYIPEMLARSAEAPIVIGSRYVPGGRCEYGLGRRLLSRTANALARVVLGLPARDCTAGFRIYRAEVLRAIDLDAIRSDGYSFLVEMLHAATRRGFRAAEVPIVFEDRTRGSSKISKREIAKAVLTLWRLAPRRIRIRAARRGRGCAACR